MVEKNFIIDMRERAARGIWKSPKQEEESNRLNRISRQNWTIVGGESRKKRAKTMGGDQEPREQKESVWMK